MFHGNCFDIMSDDERIPVGSGNLILCETDEAAGNDKDGNGDIIEVPAADPNEFRRTANAFATSSARLSRRNTKELNIHQLPFYVVCASLALVMTHKLLFREHFVLREQNEAMECSDWFVHTRDDLTLNRSVGMDGFYGRLGNRLASAEKMIGVAEKYSCNVTLPMLLDGWRGAPSRFLNMKSGDASLSNSTSSQCVIQHGKYWWGQKNMPSKCYVSMFRSHFMINLTHTFGRKCPTTPYGALHVRSGDVTRGHYDSVSETYVPNGVHHGYTPYPTSYYNSVVREVRSRRGKDFPFKVFCDDDGNPTCGFFDKLSSVDENIEFRTGHSLVDDVHLMLCAEDIALSRGTFSRIFAFSAKKRTTHRFIERSESSCTMGNLSVASFQENPRQVLYWMTSPEERKVFINLTSFWKNTGLQRDAVNKKHKVSFCYK